MRQINDNAGKESSLGHAQQKTSPIELAGIMYQPRERGYQAPGDHDACNPFARAPQFYEQCSWNLEQHISNKENAGAETKNLVGESQFTCHLQTGEADVDAIQKRNDV